MTSQNSAPGPVIPAPWQRALLGFLLLAELERAAAHGYALARNLETRGFNPVKGAALYPALGKLEAEGLVTTSWEEGQGGPGRKVYEISASGRQKLAEYRDALQKLATLI